MAERWQQWMPFHIDKFRGSPEVQAMHPAARLGYIYLLASAWQSSDCTLSADPIDLATESGLGDEMWAVYGSRILRKFDIADGRLRNARLFAEWSEALRVYQKRKSGAVRTNTSRSASDERTHTERRPDTQTITLTGTVTSTEVQEQTTTLAPAASAAVAGLKERKRKEEKPVDPRHESFKLACQTYAIHKGVVFVWDGSEAKSLAALLSAAPALTLQTFQACLNNRARSPGCVHADRPRMYLGTILSFQQHAKNQFNQPEGTEHGANKSRAEQTVVAGRATGAWLANHLGVRLDGHSQADAEDFGDGAKGLRDGPLALPSGFD